MLREISVIIIEICHKSVTLPARGRSCLKAPTVWLVTHLGHLCGYRELQLEKTNCAVAEGLFLKFWSQANTQQSLSRILRLYCVWVKSTMWLPVFEETCVSFLSKPLTGWTISRVRLLVVMHVRDDQVIVILSWVVNVDLKSFFQSDSTVEMASIITRDINNPAWLTLL